MDTPVCDFTEAYRRADPVRMHMPGHKGRPFLGPEPGDLTEIGGADELYHARGILRQSEENAAALFGADRTIYSAEGSSLCIRAMLLLALRRAAVQGLPARVLAGRNAHKTLMTAAALLDLEIDWLEPDGPEGLLSCIIPAEKLEACLTKKVYMAVFLTSPDYLGNRTDLAPLSAVCHRYGTPLLVDNAHGAYLRFLQQDLHPLSQGADLCCDSAHKTLRCLTGAAYLHVSRTAPGSFSREAEQAMALFASTSPSYLILQSLDRMNADLAGDYPFRLQEAVRRLTEMKRKLTEAGWKTVGNEPLKLTLRPKNRGYTGTALMERLRQDGIEAEFADPDFLTLMPSADTREEDWSWVEEVLTGIAARLPLPGEPPRPPRPVRVMSIRQALLGPRREMPVEAALGRVLAEASAGCPPAVPILTAGERVDTEAICCFRYYGIQSCFCVD